MALTELIDPRFFAFLIVFAVLIVTPGPDTAMVIRSALAGGWRASLFTSVGIGVGTVVWVAAALLGVALIIQRSPLAFTLLQLAGGAYLIYLGARSLIGAVRRGHERVAQAASPTSLNDAHAFRLGLVSNLLNAKSGPFFLTVLPQFIAPGDPPVRWLLMLAAYEVMMLLWLGAYGLAVTRVAAAFTGSGFRRTLEAITGLVLIAFGARLLIEPR